MRTINKEVFCKEAFFADSDVAEMVGWVAARFDDALGWTHTWVDRKSDDRWHCHGLRDAFRRWCAETSVRRGPGHRDGRRGMIST